MALFYDYNYLMENYYHSTSDEANIDLIYEPGLYLSSQTAAYNFDLLEILGIKSVLIIAKHMEPAFPENFKYHIIADEDFSSEDLLTKFPEAIEFISS